MRTGSFEDYIRLSFDLININTQCNHAVFQRMLRALALIASQVVALERKTVLREQAVLVLDFTGQTLKTDYEKQCVQDLYGELRSTWL